MQILVINCGSSSIKFRLAEVSEKDNGELKNGQPTFEGSIKGIGRVANFEVWGQHIAHSNTRLEVRDHMAAVHVLFNRLGQSFNSIDAVGHRVVHGGDQYVKTMLITQQVEEGIDALSELAPLHNPACLAGIRGAKAALGSSVPMVAVFDTAFHQTLPEVARRYAIPRELAERHRIRRYGFHGIAHASLANGYATSIGKALEQVRLITLQLGNGCSIAAVAEGRSVDTSMGFTPLEGLVMGTRSGDVDASIVSYLCKREKVEPPEVERWLNEQSGLLGLSGRSNDMKELLRAAEQEHDKQAEFAIELFCYRVRKYLGSYLAVLGGADAIVFGGGMGENAPEIRKRISQGMDWCGWRLDVNRNGAAVGAKSGSAVKISTDDSKIMVYVVAADEETWIAKETARCVQAMPS